MTLMRLNACKGCYSICVLEIQKAFKDFKGLPNKFSIIIDTESIIKR